MFKELGQFENAIELYENIPVQDSNLSPEVCIAAIRVTIGDYRAAISSLANIQPRTKSDWVAYHVLGMAYLKDGQISEAREIFSNALDNMPFESERMYFKTALALASIRDRDYDRALQCLQGSSGYVSNILYLHVYAGQNKFDLAKSAFRELQSNCPPNVVQLRDHIAVQAGLIHDVPGMDGSSIFDQECNMLSLEITQQRAA